MWRISKMFCIDNCLKSTNHIAMHSDFKIIPIPAFEDNYIWLLHNQAHAMVVDPGDAEPVLATLKSMQLTLTHILVTHHHADHIGGVDTLIKAFPNVRIFAPKHEQYHFPHVSVAQPDTIILPEFIHHGAPLQFSIIDLPGHTLGHIAYYANPILFCGDTLFAAGCGRLFEGTHAQLYDSLQKLANLPHETFVFCTHEYTLKNIQFALTIEPSNQALRQRLIDVNLLRKNQKPSLPSTIGIELETNPFLRCKTLLIQQNTQFDGSEHHHLNATPLDVFESMREKRNTY